jgi:PadR family transcriptional regulator, regulatory protein PadR
MVPSQVLCLRNRPLKATCCKALGHSIALAIEHGSLYPAVYRLEDRGWIASFWGTSENNRKAKYYRLTPAGRKQLAVETSRWQRLVSGISQILRPAEE